MDTDSRSASVHFEAVIFDMDGVVTRTAELHAAAWQELFDAYLSERLKRGEPGFRPFDIKTDYFACIDGKPRYEGVRSFLTARGITLPEGDPADCPDENTICGLGKRKDEMFERRLRASGAAIYSSTVALIKQLRSAGVRIGLVTSSQHGREVLASASVTELFDVVLDGVDAAKLGLKGKPNPDIYLKAVERLECQARKSIVIEDSVAGVQAGREGGFGLVVGVDRGGNRHALIEAGADLVVGDLDELSIEVLGARFQEAAEARARRESSMLDEKAWRIEQEGFDPAREHEMESIFTVGNGYLGVRGALDTPLPGSQADLFVAGIYDRKQPSLPYSEFEFLTQGREDYPCSEIVPLPFPLALRVSVDDQPLDLINGPWREHRRTLDMKRGLLCSHYRFEDAGGRRTLVEAWRCASLADLHLLMQEVRVTCENYAGMVEIETSIRDADLEFNHPHLQPQEVHAPPNIEARQYVTSASKLTIALASRACLSGETHERACYRMQGRTGSPVQLRRYVCIYTSRDGPDPEAAAIECVSGKRWDQFESERATHEARWCEFWEAADVRIDGSSATTQALRFNAYHLRIAADYDPRVSVGARTLSGRGYEGHVFWDVEIFMLPFYLHVCPDIARVLLMYRHLTLDGARERARELGYRGACYAWESTLTGADTTPRWIVLKTSGRKIPIYTGIEQVHVTADIAYAVCRYFDATQDDAFMLEAGAEILLETARFWASRCVRGPSHYHIRGVTGPDEYHHTVDDNAYTNWMGRFNLEKAVWVADWLAVRHANRWAQLQAALALAREEISSWQDVARELYCPQPTASGVIEQFEGFFQLQEYRIPEWERFKPPLTRLFEAEEINRRQLIKQADVLMLLFLFPDQFSREVLAANYSYYEPRTDHGSSLSPSIHAALAARLGLRREAERYWRRSLWLDLSNTMGNSALGVHSACMGGTWQALVFGLLGVAFSAEDPAPAAEAGARLPEEWRTVDLKLAFRGRALPVRVSRRERAR
ncbi:MAG TPA: HAD-IA family hydrolase [Steroidobacteraceae bacterium]|nr:HAD-IA family hydrolase [Steroidobacteraceae bacterium]